MRLPKSLALVAALMALTALSGCGDDNGDGPSDDLKLPAADDMASVVKIVNEHAQCGDLRKGSEGSGDSGDDQVDLSYLSEESADPDWAISERAVCKDAEGGQITLLTVSDMTKFQRAASEAEAKDDGKEFLVGQNFAVVPTGGDTIRQLMTGGLFFMSCDPDRRSDVPSGYQTHEGRAKDCFMTDYIAS